MWIVASVGMLFVHFLGISSFLCWPFIIKWPSVNNQPTDSNKTTAADESYISALSNKPYMMCMLSHDIKLYFVCSYTQSIQLFLLGFSPIMGLILSARTGWAIWHHFPCNEWPSPLKFFILTSSGTLAGTKFSSLHLGLLKSSPGMVNHLSIVWVLN